MEQNEQHFKPLNSFFIERKMQCICIHQAYYAITATQETYALTVLIHCAYVNLKFTAKLPIYLGFGGKTQKIRVL